MALDDTLFDPELRGALGAVQDDLYDIAATRERHRTEFALSPVPTDDGVDVRNEFVHSRDGHNIAVRIYHGPHHRTKAGAVLFIHGGGFVFGGLDFEDARCRYYARFVDSVIVSVDYRLAPEHPFPAGFNDVVDVAQWMDAHASDLGADGRLGVVGASAGGALAGALAQYRRDHHEPLAAQGLIYPVTDDRVVDGSIATYIDSPFWDGRRAKVGWEMYLGGSSNVSSYAAPARATDLTGLAPAYVSACQHDPLRDQDLEYGRRLSDAGVDVELHLFAHTYHAFDVIVPDSTISTLALQEQCAFIRRYLGENA